MWFLEHKENPNVFPSRGLFGNMIEMILFGLMFVTQGAIDYSSYTTLPARIIAAIGTFISTLIVASVTAMLASLLTTMTIQSQVISPADLDKVRVGAYEGTFSSDYLKEHQIAFIPLDTTKTEDEILTLIEQGKIDAQIEDAPLMAYSLKLGRDNGRFENLIILPWQLQPQNYGIALPTDSPWREPFNRAILDVLNDPEWQLLLDSYLKSE